MQVRGAEGIVTGHWHLASGQTPVSYTHLDVYKRQQLYGVIILFFSQIGSTAV